MKDVYVVGGCSVRLSQIASLEMVAYYQCRINLINGQIIDLYGTSDEFVKSLSNLKENFQLQ